MKNKIQKQFLRYYILFSVCPLILLSVFSYQNVRINSENRLISSIKYDLKQTQASLDEIYTRVIKYMDIISNSKEFYDVTDYMAEKIESGSYDAAQYAGVSHLDSLLDSLFATDNTLTQALVFIEGHCVYSYKSYFPIMSDQKQNALLQISSESYVTHWAGIYENPFDYFLGYYTAAVKDIKSVFSGEPNQSVCQFVILLSQGTVNSLLQNSTHYPGSMVAVFDRQDRLLAVSSSAQEDISSAYQALESLSADSLKKGEEAQIQNYGKDVLMCSFSQLSGWKLVQLIPRKYVENASRSIVTVTLLIVAGLILAMSAFSLLMSKKFLSPIQRLAGAMKEVGNKNFSISVSSSMNNEIGQIYTGFNEMVAKLDLLFKETIEKENQKRIYHISMLKYQINPHFLYNTLSSARYLAMSQKDDKTAEILLVLSRLLRNTINNPSDEVLLSMEIANIKDYLYLQQVRYENGLTVIYQISDLSGSLLVPSMILQPLVENSITHGLNERLNSGRYSEIKIAAAVTDKRLILSIRDNGVGLPEDRLRNILKEESSADISPAHIGILNIHKRIRLKYGKPYGISIKSEEGKYACAQILLPVIEKEQEELP